MLIDVLGALGVTVSHTVQYVTPVGWTDFEDLLDSWLTSVIILDSLLPTDGDPIKSDHS